MRQGAGSAGTKVPADARLFGTDPLFPAQGAIPKINFDVGLLSVGHTEHLAERLGNGITVHCDLGAG